MELLSDTGFWIDFFKVVSLISGGLFAALGLLTNFKDKSGQITHWGKIALGGIVVSLTVSLTLYYLEAAKKKQDAQIAADRADAMLQTLKKISLDQESALRQQQDIVKRQSEQVALQEKQLGEMRRLYLAQYRLTGVEISWAVPADTDANARAVFEQSTGIDRSLRTYLAEAGELAVTQSPDKALKLFANMRTGYQWYALDSAPALAFEKVLRLTRACDLSVTLAPEISVVDMRDQAMPCSAKLSKQRFSRRPAKVVSITVGQLPEIRLSQLDDAQFTFQISGDDRQGLPERIRLRALDPAVSLDAELTMNWKEVVVGERVLGPGDAEPIMAFSSGPHRVRGKFNQVLFPRGR